MSEKSDASTGRSYCVNFKMSKKKAKRKKTSDVWTFFEPLPMGPNDDKPWAKCEYCDATFLKTCTRRETHDIGPLHLSQNNGSLSEFATFEMNDLGPQKSQLEVYLDEPKLKSNMDLDILAFWEASKFRYPEVACMARDILSIPVSTVASKSTFNVGGRVIDQFRSSLKPNILEALVCTKDWLYGEEEHTQMKLDELPEDIIAMDIHSNSKDIPISLGAKANSVNILEHD